MNIPLLIKRALRIGSRINNSTSGSVLFIGSSNKLSEDNSNLYWDDANNRLGVRTTTPASNLDVVGTARFGDSTTNFAIFSSTGDLIFFGSSGVPFGAMYAKNASITVTVSAANTAYEVTTGITGGLVNRTSFGGNHYISVTDTGIFKVDYNISAQTSTAGDEIEIGVMLNGSEVTTDGGAHGNIVVANKSINMSGSAFVDCTAANDQLSLYVRNHTAARNIVIEHLNMSIVMAGGT